MNNAENGQEAERSKESAGSQDKINKDTFKCVESPAKHLLILLENS